MALPVGAIMGAVAGIGQTIFGGIQARRARKALESYRRQDLNNVFENVKISTVGSDLMREENARNVATSVDALQQAGVRGVIGGLPRILASNNALNRNIRGYLDDQINRREVMIAQDDARIRSMQERREEADLAGLGQQLNVGQQNMWNGIGTIVSAGQQAANGGSFLGGAVSEPTRSPVSSVMAGNFSSGIIENPTSTSFLNTNYSM
ncbi:MAG: hypothetical protein ACWA5P_02010 [bacterium]